MARAKNTNRAEARRRTREQQRVEDAVITNDAAAVAVAPDPGPSLGSAMRNSLRVPDVIGDLRRLPAMILHTRKLWIPFIALVAAFIVALLLPRSAWTYLGDGVFAVVQEKSVFPEGMDRIAALFVQLTLPPTALFIFFIGGFLAPRASYLVGATLGLVDGLLWAAYIWIAQGGKSGTKAATLGDVIAIILIAIVIGTLAAGFAAWYRNFLRQSQERAKANRAAREAQMRAKAKEDERTAKEEQRKAATAAREAAKAAPKSSTTKTSTSKGAPPSS